MCWQLLGIRPPPTGVGGYLVCLLGEPLHERYRLYKPYALGLCNSASRPFQTLLNNKKPNYTETWAMFLTRETEGYKDVNPPQVQFINK